MTRYNVRPEQDVDQGHVYRLDRQLACADKSSHKMSATASGRALGRIEILERVICARNLWCLRFPSLELPSFSRHEAYSIGLGIK